MLVTKQHAPHGSRFTDIEVARLMRGNVPEWDNTYIEKAVPKELWDKLCENEWIDDEGFCWSIKCMYATKVCNTGENVVVVASKYVGQGESLLQVIAPDSSIRMLQSRSLM